MFREDAIHELDARTRERYVSSAPITWTVQAFQQAAPGQAVDEVGDPSTRHQHLSGDLAMQQGALMVQRLENGELGGGELMSTDVFGRACMKGGMGPGEDRKKLQGTRELGVDASRWDGAIDGWFHQRSRWE